MFITTLMELTRNLFLLGIILLYAPVLAQNPPNDISDITISYDQDIDKYLLEWNDDSDDEEGFLLEQFVGQELIASTEFPPDTESTIVGYERNAGNIYVVKSFKGTLKSSGKFAYARIDDNLPVTPVLAGENFQDEVYEVLEINSGNDYSGIVFELAKGKPENFTQILSISEAAAGLGFWPAKYFDLYKMVADTSFFVRAYTFNSKGRSEYSNIIEFIHYTMPPRMENFTLTLLGDDKLVFTWDLNRSPTRSNEDGIEVTIEKNGELPEIDSLPRGTLSHEVAIEPDSYYHYKFNIFNKYDRWVITGDTVTPPKVIIPSETIAPFAFSAKNSGFFEIKLEWSPGSTNEDGFVIEASFDGSNEFIVLDTVAKHTYSHSVKMNGNEGIIAFRIGSFNVLGISYSDIQIVDLAGKYPIPATDILYVRINVKNFGRWEVVNSQGQIANLPVEFRADEVALNISSLKAGIYKIHYIENGVITDFGKILKAE